MSKKTHLYDTHKQAGAKMVPFAGFDMPVWYNSIKEEHFAVRKNVGIFDISHMGVIEISGEGAFETLQYVSCNDVNKSMNGTMVYSMVLNENGCVLDDVMHGFVNNKFVLVVNASNQDKILHWIEKHKKNNVTVNPLAETHGFIAIQGPKAIEKVASVFGFDFNNKPRFSLTIDSILGKEVYVLRTGYTGEDGVELVVHKDIIAKVWNKLIENNCVPCGLGARDTLRMEAGLPLYGQELSETITPLMTRYKWVLKFDTNFLGKQMLESKLKDEPEFKTVGLKLIDKSIPRTNYIIKEGGYITSGTMSPSLGEPIAMALVKPQYSEIGSKVTVDIRGKEFRAEVVKVPFI